MVEAYYLSFCLQGKLRTTSCPLHNYGPNEMHSQKLWLPTRWENDYSYPVAHCTQCFFFFFFFPITPQNHQLHMQSKGEELQVSIGTLREQILMNIYLQYSICSSSKYPVILSSAEMILKIESAHNMEQQKGTQL